MNQEYQHKQTSVFLVNYHFVWCPKRRRKILVNKLAERLRELIQRKAGELGFQVLALEINPDHLHLFASCPLQLSPHQIVGRIKGYTSRILRQEFPFLKRMPSLWTRSYFVSTAENVSSEAIQRYIDAQSRR
ncbi:IS200/IS605 family transposase [Dehalococcoidia bacterium]|nr:IS200/IS605 family transposase [Dehalococcoidia bacterium]